MPDLTSTRVFTSVDEIVQAKGERLGASGWRAITQQRIQRFADATDDHQWIHVDADRAAEGPYGGTIAHGYLTLSLIPAMTSEAIRYDFDHVRLNYGFDRVRFLSPVRAGANVRDVIHLLNAESTASGTRVTLRHSVEIETADKPACVAETITLVVGA